MSAHMRTWPVSTGQFHSSAFRVDYFDAFGGEREFDVLDVEKRDFAEEVKHVFVVGCNYA